MLTGEENRRNCRYWNGVNPHFEIETHSQTPQKVHVWAGIFGNHNVVPFFIECNLNVDSNPNLLQEYVEIMIEHFLKLIIIY